MREMSVTEQRYKAVLAVIANGRTVGEVATELGVCRQTMHRWLARYEDDGLEGLGNRSCRPAHCPHQMPPGRGGDGARNASSSCLLGSAANRLRAGSQGRRAGALRVRCLSLPGPGCGHRPEESTPAPGELEALGARRTDGALAAGCRAWVRAGRWHGCQGVDWH